MHNLCYYVTLVLEKCPLDKKMNHGRRKATMILPELFCWIFTLQSGVLGTSVVGLTLVLITFLTNTFGENPDDWTIRAGQYCVLLLYLGLMSAAFVLGFLAAFWDSKQFLKVASIILLVCLVLYVIFTVLSLVPVRAVMVTVCPGFRCPDHHWLLPSQWREQVMNVKRIEEDQRDNTTTTTPTTEKSDEEKKKKSSVVIILYMLGSVLLSVIFCAYLVWTILTYLGYAWEIENYSGGF